MRQSRRSLRHGAGRWNVGLDGVCDLHLSLAGVLLGSSQLGLEGPADAGVRLG